jgi:hypothetical protein
VCRRLENFSVNANNFVMHFKVSTTVTSTLESLLATSTTPSTSTTTTWTTTLSHPTIPAITTSVKLIAPPELLTTSRLTNTDTVSIL